MPQPDAIKNIRIATLKNIQRLENDDDPAEEQDTGSCIFGSDFQSRLSAKGEASTMFVPLEIVKQQVWAIVEFTLQP